MELLQEFLLQCKSKGIPLSSKNAQFRTIPRNAIANPTNHEQNARTCHPTSLYIRQSH